MKGALWYATRREAVGRRNWVCRRLRSFSSVLCQGDHWGTGATAHVMIQMGVHVRACVCVCGQLRMLRCRDICDVVLPS